MHRINEELKNPKHTYEALLHIGDISYARAQAFQWDQFGALVQPVASQLPYLVGIGNHEYCHTSGGSKDPSGAAGNGWHPSEGNYGNDSNGECGVPTSQRFHMPDNGNGVFWYSFDTGLVHHTFISSEHDYSPSSRMYTWLEHDLQSVNRRITPWIFLHMHRPMYTSEEYASDYKVSLLMRKYFEDLLYRYGVDIVFAGHYHAYERSCPVYKEECRTGPKGEAEAPVHIVVGTGGAWADDAAYYDVPWRISAQETYGYSRVHVHNNTHTHVQFVRNYDNQVADDFWVHSNHQWQPLISIDTI